MTPKSIVDSIEAALGLTGSPRETRDAIERVLLNVGLDVAAAAEQSDRHRRAVLREIERRQDYSMSTGEISVLSLRERTEIVHGSCFVFTDDTDGVRQAKLNRVSANDIYKHIRGLSFSQFERFGRSVLQELGCAAKVTPHANDQGIDFFGKLTVGGLLNADPAILKLMHETQVILVGQAKHYPNRTIGPAVIRELVGAMALSRTRTFSSEDIELFDEVELRPFSPVLALLFSTGEFTKGARQLAKRAGLIAFSGWQLAVFLADKGVGLVAADSQPRPAFDAEAFNVWLDE